MYPSRLYCIKLLIAENKSPVTIKSFELSGILGLMNPKTSKSTEITEVLGFQIITSYENRRASKGYPAVSVIYNLIVFSV